MPIHAASWSGKTQIVNLLIEHNSSLLNAKGRYYYTPLHWAASEGHIEIVQALLNRGADVTAKSIFGDMPIHLAAKQGETQIVNLLIEHNSSLLNVQGRDNYTPLHWAARYGHTKTVQALLNKGAAFDLRDRDGYTPLEVAYNKDVASLLRSRGATKRNFLERAASTFFGLFPDGRKKRAIEENLFFSPATLPRSTRGNITAIAPIRDTQANIATVGIAYNQSQELPYNYNNSSTISFNSFLTSQNLGLFHCIANATDNSSSRAYQTLKAQGVNFIPSTEAAVDYGMRKFDLFVNKQIRTLSNEDQNRIRSDLKTARPDIMESFTRGVEFSGNKGLDDVLAKSKECFVSTYMSGVNVSALNREVVRN